MDNENFYGWGNEDFERYYRFERQGYGIYRSDGVLYHLSHPRDLNGYYRSSHQYQWTTDHIKQMRYDSKL